MNEEIIGQIGLAIFLVFGVTFLVSSFYYWIKLHSAYKKEKGEELGWSQEKLNEALMSKDVVGFNKMGFDNMGTASWVIFKMKTDNPVLQKPLRCLRITLLAFVLFPFVLVSLLIVLTVLFVW